MSTKKGVLDKGVGSGVSRTAIVNGGEIERLVGASRLGLAAVRLGGRIGIQKQMASTDLEAKSERD